MAARGYTITECWSRLAGGEEQVGKGQQYVEKKYNKRKKKREKTSGMFEFFDSSGTTAHVGISLYGVSKSGSRHLQRDGAFQRGSLDQFHLETDDNLGEVWKIRIWHDNTGLANCVFKINK